MSGQIRMRPGYQKLLEDARAGAFDVVVAEALDRLSRDQEDVAGLFKHLRFAGVRLVTLAEGEISELHVGLKGTMNALFLKDLAAKTHRGLHGRVEQGRSAGGISYGYKVAAASTTPGARRSAAAARSTRTRPRSCSGSLRRSRRAARRATSRSASTARASPAAGPDLGPIDDLRQLAARHRHPQQRALRRRLVWNRQRFIKDPTTGKRQARLNPPEEWVRPGRPGPAHRRAGALAAP